MENSFIFNINSEGELFRRSVERIDDGLGFEFVKEVEDLTPKEKAVFDLWSGFSDLMTNLFRFYAGILEDGREWLVLEFEFYYFIDKAGEAYMERINSFIADLKSSYPIEETTMDEGTHIDHSWRTEGATGEKLVGSDKYGPDHGRPFRQVDISINLIEAKLSRGDVKMLMEKLREDLRETGLMELTVSVL